MSAVATAAAGGATASPHSLLLQRPTLKIRTLLSPRRPRSSISISCTALRDAPAPPTATAKDRVFNFAAGPANLPESVILKAQAELFNYRGSGMSIMEMSHRSKEFDAVIKKAESDLRLLLSIPDDYAVLFLQGGATTQFAALPLNLCTPDSPTDYIITGSWGDKAYKEAQKYCKPTVVWSGKPEKYTKIPSFDSIEQNPDARFLHICSNETIHGVEFKDYPTPTSTSALLQGLSTPFLSGSRTTRTLLAAPTAGGKNAEVAPRRNVVVAAAASKKSWIPAVKGGPDFLDPEWLDGSLPGDYGFDPLGLGKDPAFLKWYREAELIHGRWAMAAVVGIFVGQAWSGIPWFEAGADPGAIAPFSFGSLLGTQLILMGWVESKRWVDFFNPESQSVEWATPWSRTAENFANATGEQGYPGGKFFDPLGFAGTLQNGVYVPDNEKLERLKLAEIKHARLAMVAMLIFYFEAGQGKTPLGALGL